MEDDDDKVRRNLVVASSLIIVLAVLDVPVASWFRDVMKAPSDWTPSPFRLWLIVMAVLFYTALRFRFSKQGQAIAHKVAARFASTVHAHARPWVFANGVPRFLASVSDDRKPEDVSLAGPAFLPAQGTANFRIGSGTLSQQDYAFNYRLPWPLRLRALAHGFFRAIFYSVESTTLLIPVWLACIAFGIAAFKAARALLAT